ncbi:MAG TPA: DedA family protein/thiosulfate sulfurtransferase GlpE [Burkholderiaceae bacterium]|nr:DedA family protein/thiosulfate sulfurtransferase GlpE [Burkholderiaceae bacterium]
MQLLLTLIEQYGLWLVFANVLALQLGAPVPAYPTLIVVGAVASRGDFSVAQVVAVAIAASLIADLTWYVAGARLGRRVLRLMCRISLSPDTCVRQTEDLYERWGPPSLMFAKFVPGFAAIATSMAGVVRTPLPSFAFFDAIGALLWSGLAVALGWIFRDAVGDVLAVLAQAGRWGLIGLVLLLALYVAAKAAQRYRLVRSLRMARIGVDELNEMMASGRQPLVIDVRSKASQKHGRIPGAVWVDSHAFDENLQSQALQRRTAEEVVVYCACPNEASAAQVAKKLMRAGFRRVRPLAGGIEAWIARGYLVELPEPGG